jgi:hypothetical protein
MACDHPNLQNIPKGGPLRSYIRAPEGRVFVIDAEQAAAAKAWLERAMIEGMNTVVNGMDEGHVLIEVEGRIVRSWAEGG